ncbi:3-phytase A [Colletotrichum shisoi]|uniref:Phytase A n=1 Tax=Colletotrichum shisoi TaxID=2078593 RepID=A0A5Q4BGC8_9PEZI|nr:3-phytase A [Colletotrichum shisoi]
MVQVLWLALGFISLGAQAQAEPVSHFWGTSSPWFSVSSEIDAAIPSGCQVTFVQAMSRHGSRNPNASKLPTLKALINRIQTSVTRYGEGFEFIKTYEPTFVADQLTPFGKKESTDSGRWFYKRYRALAAENDPFIRSMAENRVLESIQLWKSGFYGAKMDDGHPQPDKSAGHVQVLPITEGFNNTLHHGLCTAFENSYSARSKAAQAQWLQEFAPPVAVRINKNLPGAEFTLKDVHLFMQLCPLQTVLNGKTSEFCSLFTAEEWKDFEYLETLNKFYTWSKGNPLGPTQGVGFTNELIARLTRQPVVDHTSTNATLTGDPATFPLDKKIYVDFTRGNTMVAVLSALGLFDHVQPLDKARRASETSQQQAEGFKVSQLIPFAGRMFVEKMKCDGGDKDEEFVRVIVNDRVMQLQGCDSDELGRCKLDRFVDSLDFAKRGGEWDKCFP